MAERLLFCKSIGWSYVDSVLNDLLLECECLIVSGLECLGLVAVELVTYGEFFSVLDLYNLKMGIINRLVKEIKDFKL